MLKTWPLTAEEVQAIVDAHNNCAPPPTPEPSDKALSSLDTLTTGKPPDFTEPSAYDVQVAPPTKLIDTPELAEARRKHDEGYVSKALLEPSAKVEKCPACEGKGCIDGKDDTSLWECPTCKGTGHVAKVEGEL